MLIRNNKGAGVLVRGNAVAHYSITGEKYTHGTTVLSNSPYWFTKTGSGLSY